MFVIRDQQLRLLVLAQLIRELQRGAEERHRRPRASRPSSSPSCDRSLRTGWCGSRR